MTHDRDVQERLHLVKANEQLIAVAISRAEGKYEQEDLVVLVLDTRDDVARDLAQVLAERSADLDLTSEEARILRKPDMVPTGIAVMPVAAARVGFAVSHPHIADGLRAMPPVSRVRIVVVASGGATLLHLPVVKLAARGDA